MRNRQSRAFILGRWWLSDKELPCEECAKVESSMLIASLRLSDKELPCEECAEVESSGMVASDGDLLATWKRRRRTIVTKFFFHIS